MASKKAEIEQMEIEDPEEPVVSLPWRKRKRLSCCAIFCKIVTIVRKIFSTNKEALLVIRGSFKKYFKISIALLKLQLLGTLLVVSYFRNGMERPLIVIIICITLSYSVCSCCCPHQRIVSFITFKTQVHTILMKIFA